MMSNQLSNKRKMKVLLVFIVSMLVAEFYVGSPMNTSTLDLPSSPREAQAETPSFEILDVNYPDKLSLSSYIRIHYRADHPGELRVVIYGQTKTNDEAFPPNIIEFEIEGIGEEFVYVPVQVWLATLPGNVTFILNIHYVNANDTADTVTESFIFSILIDMSYFGVLMLLSLGLTSFVLIKFQTEELRDAPPGAEPPSKEEEKKEVPKPVAPPSSQGQHAFPQIICPDCNKSIDKGSAFCEHCGFHLPLYQRN